MKIGGHKRQIDFERLGPSLVIAASLVLAIRTAKKTVPDAHCSLGDWDKEIEHAGKVAHMILSKVVQNRSLLQQENVRWFIPDDGDVPE